MRLSLFGNLQFCPGSPVSQLKLVNDILVVVTRVLFANYPVELFPYQHWVKKIRLTIFIVALYGFVYVHVCVCVCEFSTNSVARINTRQKCVETFNV